MDPKKRKYIQEFIRNNEAIVISSNHKGYPHVSTLYYSENKDCTNLYFTSTNDRIHSDYHRNKNSKTAGAIFAYDKKDLGIQEGIQFQGHIYRVKNLKEALFQFAVYFKKLPFAKQFFSDLSGTVKKAAEASLYKIEINQLKFFSYKKDYMVEEYTKW